MVIKRENRDKWERISTYVIQTNKHHNYFDLIGRDEGF